MGTVFIHYSFNPRDVATYSGDLVTAHGIRVNASLHTQVELFTAQREQLIA